MVEVIIANQTTVRCATELAVLFFVQFFENRALIPARSLVTPHRFAHYLKCIVRDKIGSFQERADMERWLNDWILNYVDGNPETSSQETKARRPLAAAEVVVEEVEGNPGYYTSKFFLRPHYQLEGLTVSLRLVSKLPSQKAGAAK